MSSNVPVSVFGPRAHRCNVPSRHGIQSGNMPACSSGPCLGYWQWKRCLLCALAGEGSNSWRAGSVSDRSLAMNTLSRFLGLKTELDSSNEWSLRLSDFWDPAWPLLVLLLAVILYYGWKYRQDARRLTGPRRNFLTLLR